MMTIRVPRSVILALLLLPGMLALPAPLAAAPALSPHAFSPPQSVIPACNPIAANTTWTTGNIYVVENCNLVVQAGATLTLQPGVTVKFGGTAPGYASAPGSAALIVDGAINAVGEPGNPVVFTSLKDDAHGGDTNGNGASSGAAGDWYGMVFRPGSAGQLNHFFVGYGGSGVFNATLRYGRAQVDVKQASLQLRQGVITTGLRKGVYLEGADITPVVENVQIANNVGAAGYTDRGDAVYQASINMQPTFSGNSFSGNSFNQVTIDVNTAMTRSVTLGGAPYGFICGYTLCQLVVPNGAALTVNPGTLLAFGPSYGIGIASGGALVAEGTASQPITFTSTAAAAPGLRSVDAPLAGEWIGLWAQQGSRLRLDHCDISYASDGNFGNGGLEIDADDAQVRNCRIHHNKQTGLYLAALSNSTTHPVLANVDVTDNGQTGVHFEARSGAVLAVAWDGGAISRNGWSGMSGYTWNSIINPTLRNLTIANNGTAGGGPEGRAGIYWNQHNVNPDLENLTLTGNVGTAIHWLCNGSITARNVAATGNGVNELVMPGCAVSGGRQWDLGDAGIPTRVTYHIEVTANGLLSILPGTTLHFDKTQYSTPTYLIVQDQAALYALGTAMEPIVFKGATQTPGWWTGIEANNRATLVLNHCEISYGGGSAATSLNIRWGLSGGAPAANIQNCAIHHSSKKGVHFDFNNFANTTPPIFRYNNLYDNADEAVTNWNAPPLDARDNYWGDPTGPFHVKQNPGGLGDGVGDNVLFYPWLTAPATGEAAPGQMLVSTGAPNQFSPGETVDYALQYLNQMTQTVQGAVLMLQLPQAGFFVEGTHGAVYWPDRHQVFWKLGDLAPGASGFVSVRVRFQWGLAADYTDGSFTQFAGTNYNGAALDMAAYNAYQSPLLTVTGIVNLSPGEFAAVRATSADLESLYQAALGEGFQYMSAARITYHDGTVVVNAALRTADRQFGRILSLNSDGRVFASSVSGSGSSAQDMSGGLRANLSTQTYEFWGVWQPDGLQRSTDACDADRCFRNCMLKAKAWGAVTRKVAAALSWVIPPVGAAWTTYEVYDEITTYLLCKEECPPNGPFTHCCTPGETRWSPTGLKQQCAQYSCDAVGTWKETPDKVDKCSFGQRCVAGGGAQGGCKACEEDLLAARFTPVSVRPAAADAICATSANPRCSDLTVRRAKDPNAIYGPLGDLLPGATAVYTITYENEGAGRAYGVYVVNPLPAVFDAATLNLHGKGEYLPASREIAWLVGELGPKGAVDAQGAITYTVALTGGLPSGTVVANQATVFFPSVPEETPTNTWVNLVAPLAAIPQTVATAYQTPLPITLSGREVSGLPLTFAIVILHAILHQ
ncbi:MAG: right-handed parallel beta-helix repeat-containing protein [Caldilineaceae bacterium]|nr:right-handed parallel beta-helix repeat-containing protein [Caldilineaceae bacterium]